MPSQEEYLDNLLKDLGNNEATENDLQLQNDFADLDMSAMEELLKAATDSAAAETLPSEPVGVEDTVEMTEDDIEKLLQNSRNAEIQEEPAPVEEADSLEEPAFEDTAGDELMQMLENSEEEELQDIHTMLQKSDNNEAVDGDIVSLLESADKEENFVPDFESDEDKEALFDNREKRAAEKKRMREEKKEAKRQAKAAAREARALRKEEKRKVESEGISDAEEDAADAEPFLTEESVPDTQFVSEPEEADIEPDLLEALTTAEDLFAEVLPGENMTAPFSHEEIADSEIRKLQAADKAKKPFLTRILDFLTESDEDEEKKGAEILLSDENQAIIREIDKEKGKKSKKKSKRKDGKGENNAEDFEEGQEGKSSKKENKPKKPKKPKKQKPPKLTNAEVSDRKLSKKRIYLILLICLSIGLVIFLSVNVIDDYTARRAARTAYYEGNYKVCFQNLYGKNLNEAEQVMFYKSESILRIRVWLREYELLAQEGSELKALDSLIQSVDDYASLDEFASRWNATEEVSQVYSDILRILFDKYHLTEEQAKEIAATPDDVTYTKMVMAIVSGEEFGSWNKQKEQETGTETEEQKLPDMLPEEEELQDMEFLDNSVQ